MRQRLAIITTHPIQYNAPFFKLLSQRGHISIRIFYTWGTAVLEKKNDPGFGKTIDWDIPLLEGYDFAFVDNVAIDPGSHHFMGIDNPSLIKDIEKWDADAILIFGWAFKSHLKVIWHFHKKIPVLFRGDSTLMDDQTAVKKWIRTILLRWVYTHIDIALYVGTGNKEYFLKYGVKQEQLFFAPHAIDNDRFDDKSGSYSIRALAWRSDLNMEKSDLVFLFAGKLEAKKDPSVLIEAFKMVYITGIHLIIVGTGLLETELKQKYKNIPGLHFIDFQNQSVMPVLYRLCDVFILPSKGPGETWGLSINEAMACSCAILVSKKAGAAIDLVEEGKNGMSFNPTDVIGLSEKLTFFIQNKQIAKKWGIFSKEKIKGWNYTKSCLAIEMLVNS